MNKPKLLSWYLVIGIAFSPVSFAQAQLVPTVPADTTAPVVSNITVSSITPVGAVIAWTTNEIADSQVEYGLTTGYGSSTTLNVSLGTAHLQTLTDLQSGTVYHYRVKSKDAAGNTTVSADQTFITEAAVTTSSSSSSSTSSVSSSSSAVIIEVSSSSSSFIVDVSSSSSTQTDILTQPVTTETSSAASSASSTVSSTLANVDATGPVISTVAVSATTSVGTVIAWTTDELADSQIEYGLTDSYGFETTLNVSLGTAHLQTLTDLEPGTAYHFRVKSKDAAGNVTISEDHVFTTVSASIVVDIPPAILTQSVISIMPASVTVLWTTNEISTSQIEYGLTTQYGSHTTLDTSLALEHAVSIGNLQAGTEYHYRIKTTDSAGQTTYSGDDTFTTESLTVTVEPTPNVGVPLSIANIEASALTSSSALLAWTTSTLADSQIEYGLTTNYGSHTTIDVSLGLAHAVLLNGLSPGTTYHYRVKSRDAEGNVVTSDDQVLTTLAAPSVTTSTTPPVLSDVTVTTVEPTAATIGWITDKVATSQIEYGLTAGYGSSTTLDASLGLVHSVILANLTPYTTYHYRIKTTDAGGHTTTGGDNTFTTATVTVTVEPSSSASSIVSVPLVASEVQASALTSSSALLIWTTSALADSQIEYGLTTSYGSHTTIDVSLGLAHAVLLSSLTPETTYHYRVKSRDAGGNLVVSDDQTFTTLAAPPASVSISTPPVISEVAVTTGQTTATIAWTTNKIANSQVEYGLTNAYGSDSTLNAAFANVHSVALSGLEAATTYHYRIRTTDAGGRLTVGEDNTFTTAASSSSVSVTLPSISDVEESALTSSSALIRWITSVPTDAQIEYGLTTSYGSQSTLDTALSLHHSSLLSGLNPDTTYHYRVRSIDASGNHVLSGDQDFTTLELPTDRTAPVISGVRVTKVGTTSATITWTTDDASSTRVQYGETTSYGVYTDLAATPTTVHSATVTGLFPDTTYNFNVQSEDSAGNTAISVNHTFTTEKAPYVSGTMGIPVVSHVTDTSVTLSWTVPFDDTAGLEFYDIRYSTRPITQFNFEDAIPAREGVEHIVHVSQNGQSTEHIYMIIELQAGTSYYFGVKSGASRTTLAHLEESNTNPSAQLQTNSQTSTTASTTNNEHGLANSNVGRTQGTVAAGSRASGGGGAADTQGTSDKSGGTRRLPAPRDMQAQAADGEVAFVWNSPLNSPFIHTDIVRKEGDFPTSPTDGQTVYEGRDETFTDTNLINGKKYHYAIFTHNDGTTKHAFSAPVLVAMLPTDSVEQFTVREKPPAPVLSRELRMGMKNAEVEALQRMLANDASTYPEGKVTGYFGALTQTAVKKLQEKNGLPQTGIVDAQTRNVLSGLSAGPSSTPSSTSPLSSPIPQVNSLQRDLVQGSRGDDVNVLQTFLKARGLYPIPVTGYFGAYTQAGVRKFQEQQGIPATGAVSAMTREKIRQMSVK
ncbi:fibronectin type III domain-containing protein [Candidatus Peregrinibacteria bacterium]|nr:fibronectin type III domain-containing protein [Candidatus Peregrinibacteria bacterium]